MLAAIGAVILDGYSEGLTDAGRPVVTDDLRVAWATHRAYAFLSEPGECEAGAVMLLGQTADHREAVAAFKEKRAPNYTDT